MASIGPFHRIGGRPALGQPSGQPQIDADHRHQSHLLRLIEQAVVERRPAAELEEAVEALIVFSEAHFSEETRLMRETGYGGLDGHALEHDRLIHRIRGLRQEMGRRDMAVAAADLSTLRAWFGDHIRGHDLTFARTLARMDVQEF